MILYGDIDQDGKITENDRMLSLMALDGQIQLTKEQMLIADVNGDGIFNSTDAALIGQMVWYQNGGTNYSELIAYNVYRNYPGVKISEPQIKTYWEKLLSEINSLGETETVTINSVTVDLPVDTGINTGAMVEHAIIGYDGQEQHYSTFESENKKDSELIDYIDNKDIVKSLFTVEYVEPTDEILKAVYEANNIPLDENKNADFEIMDHAYIKETPIEEIIVEDFIEPEPTPKPPIEEVVTDPLVYWRKNDMSEKLLPIDEENEGSFPVEPIEPIDTPIETPEAGGVVPPGLPATQPKDFISDIAAKLNVPKEYVLVGGLIGLYFLIKGME